MKDTGHPATDRLEAFVEGTLEAADRALVKSHLLGCPRCHSEVEEWRGLFTALEALPQFDPGPEFPDRVMAGLHLGRRRSWHARWQSAWQQQAGRAAALVARAAPKSTFGWAVAAALVALPVLIGGGAIAWLVSQSYLTPQNLWGWTRDTALEGLQGVGATVITALMQTDVAAWLVDRGSVFLATAGVTGIGALLAVTGISTMLSVWVLYRNLIRTPTRDSHYATYSF